MILTINVLLLPIRNINIFFLIKTLILTINWCAALYDDPREAKVKRKKKKGNKHS